MPSLYSPLLELKYPLQMPVIFWADELRVSIYKADSVKTNLILHIYNVHMIKNS